MHRHFVSHSEAKKANIHTTTSVSSSPGTQIQILLCWLQIPIPEAAAHLSVHRHTKTALPDEEGHFRFFLAEKVSFE